MIKKILPLLTTFLFVITVISSVIIATTLMRSNAEKKDFELLSELVWENMPNTDITDGNNTEEQTGEEDTAPQPVFKRNLAPLFEKNTECVGWVCIPDTAIDYPLMHTPREPQKYLHKNFDGEYSASGVPFLQGVNSLESDNLVIYGHNMKNGTMFGSLKKYCDEAYRMEHPVIEIETANGLQIYTIFAVAKVKNNHEWYSFISAANEDDYNERISSVKEISLYNIPITPEYGQQLVTLSTCYGGNKDDRLIVVGVENQLE